MATPQGYIVTMAVLLAMMTSGAMGFTLSETLGSNMVLQRSPARARLWGWGEPGEAITAHGSAAVVDSAGRWSLMLPPQTAGPAFGTGSCRMLACIQRVWV